MNWIEQGAINKIKEEKKLIIINDIFELEQSQSGKQISNMNETNDNVKIVEVGPRDGLQSIEVPVPTNI